MKNILITILLTVIGLSSHAQSLSETNAPSTSAPSLSGGLQQIYDAAASGTNYGFASGFARATHGNRNVGFADLLYNFNPSVGAVIGYDYCWTSKAAGVPAQANLVKGGVNLQVDLHPFKTAWPSLTVTPFGFALVASGDGKVSQIIGGGGKVTLFDFKGVNVNLGVLYENRTGAEFWDGRYVGGFLAVSKGF